MRRTLLRYLLVELAVPFFVSMFVLTLVLFLAKIMGYTKLLFASGSVWADFGKLIYYSLPYSLVFTVPMATLIAVLLAFARLAHDNEITAMKAAGIGFYQMIPPVALVTGCAWLFTLGLSLFVLPAGNFALNNALVEMARSRAHLGLKERVFNNEFTDLVFYVNRVSPDGRRLQEIFISDERAPESKRTIIADEGLVLSDTNRKALIIRLFRGTILRVGEKLGSAQTVRFQNYDFRLDLASMFPTRTRYYKGRGEMTVAELRQILAETKPGTKEHNEFLLEWHYRLSFPFACIVLGFVAAPLGVRTGTGSRLSGVCLGLLIFLLYYMFHSAAQAFGEDGNYPPAVGKWLPNFVFGILAVIMWVKTARESPFKVITILRQFGDSVLAKLRTRRQCDLS